MNFLEGKTPKERRNIIILMVVGVLALFGMYRTFFASDTPVQPQRNTNGNRPRPSPTPRSANDVRQEAEALTPPQPIVYEPPTPFAGAVGRNIFAYYVAPVRAPSTANTNSLPVNIPTPTPVPPPPQILAGLNPSNVYARSQGFTLDVSGDKFTPETRVYFGGAELQTQFRSPQQLAATVPAQLVSNAGGREIKVQTPDGVLFSNTMTFNVAAPPTPQFTFVGINASRKRPEKDIATLRNAGNELINVQRGDIVGGRFRVTGISERSIDFVDTQLNITHSLPFLDSKSADGRSPSQQNPSRPVPPQSSDEDY